MKTYYMTVIQHDVDKIVTQSSNQNNKRRIIDAISCYESCNKLIHIHNIFHINLMIKVMTMEYKNQGR